MILRYEFEKHVFWRDDCVPSPSSPSAPIHPGSDTCHQNDEFIAKAKCLFTEMGQDVHVRNLHIFATSKFGLPGSLLEGH